MTARSSTWRSKLPPLNCLQKHPRRKASPAGSRRAQKCPFSRLCSLLAAQSSRHIDALMVDLLSEPIGLDDARPVFSWKIRDTSDGARQTAYQIRVSTTNAGGATVLVWDSGRVASAQSTGIPYGGTPLQASRHYFWTVESWDQGGK